MSHSEVHDIELNMKEAKEFVDLSKALARLSNNKDFKRIIVDGYFSKEAVRLVHLKSTPGMQAATDQASIIRDIDAIGSLAQFFTVIEHKATMAKEAIVECELSLEELRNEEAD
jgi:hypothetical protein